MIVLRVIACVVFVLVIFGVPIAISGWMNADNPPEGPGDANGNHDYY